MSKFNVVTWTTCDITNFSFYTKSKDYRSTIQNSGVMVEVEFMYFSNSKNKNLILISRVYFRVIKKIWKFDYVLFKVSLFKYKWIANNIGVRTDEL